MIAILAPRPVARLPDAACRHGWMPTRGVWLVGLALSCLAVPQSAVAFVPGSLAAAESANLSSTAPSRVVEQRPSQGGRPKQRIVQGVSQAAGMQSGISHRSASWQQGEDRLSRVLRGMQLEMGVGQAPDPIAAHAAYCQAAAEGNAEAMLRLGWMYADGRGVEVSRDIAATLFDRAARFGSSAGQDLIRERFRTVREQLPECLRGTRAEAGLDDRPPRPAEVEGLLRLSLQLAPLQTGQPASDRRRLVRIVAVEARRFKLDPALVVALVAAESGFDPQALSPRGAMGLMQLIEGTADRFAVKDPFDPAQNLRGGMSYLRWLLSYFRGDVALTVAAYNAGEGQVNRYGGVPPFAETRAYLARVRQSYPFVLHAYDPQASRNSSPVAGAARLHGSGLLASDRSRGSGPSVVR